MLMTTGTGAEPLPEGDAVAGRKVARMCRTCHGTDGVARIPIAPHIGGENRLYIENQLRAFREGTRVHEMMTVVSAGLSDDAIADVAAWYASITPLADPPPSHTDDAVNAPEDCAACHGYDGIALEEDVPNLAGESAIYIQTQLKAFRLGKRSHELMNAIAEDLSDEDISDYAAWYAAIGFSTEMPEDGK